MRPMRDGMPLKYQMWETGVASLDVGLVLRRTLDLVTSDAAAVADLAL